MAYEMESIAYLPINSGLGDTLPEGGAKINRNFAELHDRVGQVAAAQFSGFISRTTFAELENVTEKPNGDPLDIGTPAMVTGDVDSSGDLTDANGTYTWNGSDWTKAPDRFAYALGGNGMGFLQDGAGAKLRSFQNKARDIVSVKDFGAIADGVIDDTAALQAAFDAATTIRSRAVFIPATNNHYRITNLLVVPSGITVYGEGPKSHIRNDNGSANYWDNCVLAVGTYGGKLSTTESVYAEATYDISDVQVFGAYKIDLLNAEDVAQFQIGDIIFIRSGDTLPGNNLHYMSANVNKVREISGASLILEYPLRDTFNTSTSGIHPCVARETGSVISTRFGGVPAVMCKNTTIRNLKLSHVTSTGGMALHVSGWECEFDNIEVEGFTAVGVNPCAHTTFKNMRVDYSWKGFEIGYYHNDVNVHGRFHLTNSVQTSNGSAANVMVHEPGSDVVLECDVFTDAGNLTGVSPAIYVASPRTLVTNSNVSGHPVGGGVWFADSTAYDSALSNSRVTTDRGNAVTVVSDRVSIVNNKLRAIASGARLVKLDTSVNECVLVGNSELIGPGGIRNNYIQAGRQNHVIEGNMTVLYWRGDHFRGSNAYTSSGAMHTTTVPGKTMARENTINIVASGVIEGTSSNKNISLTVGGKTIASINFSPSDELPFSIQSRAYVENATTLVTNTIVTKGATVSAIRNRAAVDLGNSDFDVKLECTVSGGDKARKHEVDVQLENTQFTTYDRTP